MMQNSDTYLVSLSPGNNFEIIGIQDLNIIPDAPIVDELPNEITTRFYKDYFELQNDGKILAYKKNMNGLNMVVPNQEDITTVFILSGVTELKNYDFYDFSNLKIVIIAENVKVIKKFAFENCIFLESILIPKNVDVIEEGAFSNCYKLKEVHIQNPDIIIKEDAFPDETKIIYD